MFSILFIDIYRFIFYSPRIYVNQMFMSRVDQPICVTGNYKMNS